LPSILPTKSAKKMIRMILVNSCISVIAIIISFVVLEVGIRYHFSNHANYDFEMWKYAVELKDPLTDGTLPFHHKPGKSGNYFGVEIKTNSLGLRNAEITVPKPPGTKRVLMLGDSFTLGWGVPVEDTYSRQLEKMLHTKSGAYEVVNMGTGNYNSSMEVELFKRKGLALNPDIVVLMYYINDTETTPKINRTSYFLMRHFYLPAYIGARLKQLGMMNNEKDWLQAYYRKLYATDSEGFRKAKEAINELINITSERNIRLLIVNIPDLRRLKEYPFGFATALPKGLAKDNSLPFIDLLLHLHKYDGQSLWVSEDDAHMNRAANNIAAKAIFEKIVEEQDDSRSLRQSDKSSFH